MAAGIEYPDFFPCPTWEYGEAWTTFADRTPMESGWVRQRKRWQDFHTAIDLTFQMDTETFSIWNDWVQSNGYDWFSMRMEEFQGERPLRVIRFTSPAQYTYADFNTVVVSVSAEVDREKPNPEPISVVSV